MCAKSSLAKQPCRFLDCATITTNTTVVFFVVIHTNNSTCAVQVDEQSEAVWQSAVGCLIHLTSREGQWVASHVSSLSLQAVRAMLRAAHTFNWAPELYCQLLQLAANLLYCPSDKQYSPDVGSTGFAGEGAAVSSPLDTDPGSTQRPVALHQQRVQPDKLQAFGCVHELMVHFCRAPSPEAQSNMLVPIVQELMPEGMSG